VTENELMNFFQRGIFGCCVGAFVSLATHLISSHLNCTAYPVGPV